MALDAALLEQFKSLLASRAVSYGRKVQDQNANPKTHHVHHAVKNGISQLFGDNEIPLL